MKVIALIAALVFFIGGLYLFALAFQAVGFEAIVFFAGIIAVSISLAIPFHVLNRVD